MKRVFALLFLVVALLGLGAGGVEANSLFLFGLSGRQNLSPVVSYNFLSGVFPTQITFSRASNAWFFNSSGVLTQASNNVPRLDYSPSTLLPLGLLKEQASTNQIRNNTMVGAVVGTPGTLPTNWAQGTISGSVTYAVAGTSTENGINYVDIALTMTGASSWYIQMESTTQIAAAISQYWTASAYNKLSAGSLTNISSITLNLDERSAGGGVLATSSLSVTPTNAGLATQRAIVTRQLTNASTAFVEPAYVVTSTGNASLTLRIGLPQIEQSNFATSVIPTTGTTATRAIEQCYALATSFPYSDTAGTITIEYARGNTDNTQNASVFAIGNASSLNYLNFYRVPSGSIESINGPWQGNLSGMPGITDLNVHKIGFTWNNTGTGLYGTLDGTSVITNNTSAGYATPSGVDRIFIGNDRSDGLPLNGWIRKVSYWNKQNSLALLQLVTQ